MLTTYQLNTSRIGDNVLNTTKSSGGNIVTNWLHNVSTTIENDINDDLNSFARSLGIHDFYSAHMLDYCEGYYTPVAVANSTYPAHSIHKNVTLCSNRTALYNFDPTQTLQREINASGHSNVNLTALHWPQAVDDGLAALRTAQRAAFILYCIAIGFIALVTLFAIIAIVLSGRLTAFVNILLSGLAFLAMGIASALTTAVAVKAANVVNKYGPDVGISANKGGRFMALTWVATVLMFLSMLVWMFECVVGRRRKVAETSYTANKY